MVEQLKKLPDGTELTVGRHKVKIVKYLAEGGFAHIYQVQIDPKEYDSEIACLKRVIVPDKSGLDQLRKEVDVMKKLRYARSIVRYYDSHAERLESGAYQVLVLMELCPNKSLLDLMNAKIKTKLTDSEILNIMFDISIGVFEMHRAKMVHRDIKIENVLIDANNRFKLADFGSTSHPLPPPKNQQEFQALSHEIMYQTTPQYRSPEMIDLYRGFPIDEKSDIWALGCFLYKLCYYTTPFEANGDIAILHASYQFPAVPKYPGDLQNLIIILLQENPLFRPNIVQVIKLVCKMLHVDFNTIDIEDIYNAGSYNFQALHEYQQHRQTDLMRQQQLYYQQQQQQQSHLDISTISKSNSLTKVNSATKPTPISKSNSLSKPNSAGVSIPNSAGVSKPTSAAVSAAVSIVSSRASSAEPEQRDDTLELEDLDDVEERYPSLEKIDTPVFQSPVQPKVSHTPAQVSPQVAVGSQLQTQVQYPIQPQVLSPQQIQNLTPEQLKQYNYQHQTYNTQVNQMYYQQHKQFQTNMERTASGNYLQNKEAWEINDSKVDGNAGKLADDIFGSKSRSPTDVKNQPQKTSQSIKSEPAIDSENELEESQGNVRLTKSNNSSKGDVLHDTDFEDFEDKFGPSELELNIGQEVRDKVKTEISQPQVQKTPVQQSPIAYHSALQIPQQVPQQIPQQTVQISSQKVSQNVPKQPQHPTQISVQSQPQHPTQIPVQIPVPPPPPQQHQQPSPSPPQMPTRPGQKHASLGSSKNPFPASPETKFLEPKSKSNPWGEYRNSNTNVASLDPLQGMNNLSLDDPKTSRKPSNEQPNLIDLEVGLDSEESSVSLPPITSNENLLSESDSLIDLDEGKFKRSADRPYFKTKGTITNPSDFKVQEEVIDWASDDEDPGSSSMMNRLSIRNSLKTRKSSEHKRSDSTDKKRRSRLISN